MLSIVVLPLPLPEEPTPREERLYQEVLFGQVFQLQELGGSRMCESKQRVCTLTRGHEDKREMPTLLFHFQPGQFILKHHRHFTKVDARAHGPFHIRRVLLAG